MISVALRDLGVFDLALTPHLEQDEGLQTAVALSLLTDIRADPSDVPKGWDLSGWWGDSYPDVQGDRFGSKLWTLSGRPADADTLALAEHYSRSALQWMIQDGIASEVLAQCAYAGRELRVNIGLQQQDGVTRWLGTWTKTL